MPDQPATGEPPAGPPADGVGEASTLTERMDRVEGKLDSLLDKLGSQPAAQRREERKLDEPSTVAEQVQAELKRGREEDAARQAADADKAERASMREELAKLREKPPREPVRRLTRLMHGRPS